MNRLIAILTGMLMMALFAACEKDVVDKETLKSNISDIANLLVKNYKERNIDGIMSLYADSPDIIEIGRFKHEVYIGKDAVRTGWLRFLPSLPEIVSNEYKVLSVNSSGDVAWAVINVFTTYKTSQGNIEVHARHGFVLKLIDGKWKIMQHQITWPVVEAREQVKQPAQEKDSVDSNKQN